VLDPEFFSTLYSQTNRFDKYQWYYSMLGNPEATFATIRSDTHKLRRGALNPFFSPTAISKFQGKIQEAVDKLVERMEKCAPTEDEIPLFYAFRCITVDLIGLYVFGTDLGLMSLPDWGRDFYTSWRGLWNISPLIRQFPWMLDMFMAMPRWLLAIVNKDGLGVVDMFAQVDKLTFQALDDDAKIEAGQKKAKPDQPFPRIICEVARDESLPPSERSPKRLAVEANSLIAAGFETTGHTLTHVMYNILTHPKIFDRLVQELEEAIPDPAKIPPYQTLEKLPLVNACIKESLRLSVGAYGRLARVSRTEDVKYKDWVIPKGVSLDFFATVQMTI
jgi:cytochrome P450